MHTGFALLCFVVVIHWLIFLYPSGLLHWHCGNLTIAPVPAKQPWWIWINTSCEFIMNDCITTTKQSTKIPCAYFLGYTVAVAFVKHELDFYFCMWHPLFHHYSKAVGFLWCREKGHALMVPNCMTYQTLKFHVDGFVQERHNSIANALEIHLFCTNPSMWNLQLESSSVRYFLTISMFNLYILLGSLLSHQ